MEKGEVLAAFALLLPPASQVQYIRPLRYTNPVIVLHWIAFVITLAMAGLSWGLYALQPNLLLGTPWGPVHVGFLVAGAFALGVLVVWLYVLANWVRYRGALRSSGRELKQAKAEVALLKKSVIEETPVIPDRE